MEELKKGISRRNPHVARRNAFRCWRGGARHVWLQPGGRLVELEQQV